MLGAVNRAAAPGSIVVGAAGGLPGELHKLWRVPRARHLSPRIRLFLHGLRDRRRARRQARRARARGLCAGRRRLLSDDEFRDRDLDPARAEAQHRPARQWRLRLHRPAAAELRRRLFNNLFAEGSGVDFAAHAASLGAVSCKVGSIAELETALEAAKAADRTSVIVIASDPVAATREGGAWWDVAVPEVSERAEVTAARQVYETALTRQKVAG